MNDENNARIEHLRKSIPESERKEKQLTKWKVDNIENRDN